MTGAGAPSALGRFAAKEHSAVWLALTALVLVFLPKYAAALTAMLFVAVGAALFAALGEPRDEPIRHGWPVLAAMVAPAVVLTISALFADSPALSLVGSVGQHAGAATWIAVAALGVAVLATSRPGDLGRISRAAGVFGAVLALAQLAESAGLYVISRGGAPAAGLFENSLSTGQVLIVCLFCAVAWCEAAPSQVQRAVAGACVLLIVAAVWNVGSVGTWVGLAAGVTVAGVLYALARARKVRANRLGLVPVVLAVLLVLVMGVVLGTSQPGALEKRLAAVSSDRLPVWHAARVDVLRSPLLGVGPEQFTAFTKWEPKADGGVNYASTYDPHNLLVYMLVSGGLLGFAALMFSSGVLGRAVLKPLETTPSIGRSLLVGGVAAWVVTVMFVWINPLAMALAVCLVAMLVEPEKGSGGAGIPARMAAIASAVAALVVIVGAFAAGAAFELRAGSQFDADGSMSTDLAYEALESSPDPQYAYVLGFMALREATNQQSFVRSDPRFADVEIALERDSEWHAALALMRFKLELLKLAEQPDKGWTLAESALDAGKQADPYTGFWDYYASQGAAAYGFSEEAERHAREALKHPLPDSAKTVLETQFGIAE